MKNLPVTGRPSQVAVIWTSVSIGTEPLTVTGTTPPDTPGGPTSTPGVALARAILAPDGVRLVPIETGISLLRVPGPGTEPGLAE
ncbi:hypothetical protein [Actinocorallia populi]|uniref:hypothetical protein n=1 Tax=Actinocorallia populi TaxID=2079200 RepID=UPI0013006914|nr:hypothetical protein [Actinocorallia populi]